MNWNEFRVGVNRGLPVGLGYFSVSFGFGAMAVAQGVSALNATLISGTNLTSAGQFAGLTLIVAGATLWEMILTMLVINSRYSLMSLALSQRMGQKIVGWTLGTLSGGLAGSVLPESIRAALGVMLYGMFIAIVIPPAKKEREIFITMVLALICSCLFAWVPALKTVSAGISIVICTVAAAAVCAWLFPIPDEEVAA